MKGSSQSSRTLRFGAFEFDPRSGELRKQGMKVHLQGQPLEILAALLERPGDVVTREELKSKLWPVDTFVDFEHSLNAAIKRLRAALDDGADNPRFVETLARRGYRFIAPVDGATAVAARRRTVGTLVLGALIAVVLAAVPLGLNVGGWRARLLGRRSPPRIRSLAVLPLENFSRNPEQEYFVDGMTEALIAELAQISALRVISRTSAMRYKGTKKPLAEIARELNVDAVVEGSVLRAGDRVRITAQLVEAPSDTHLLARSYERDLRDVLALQREVARALAGEIQAKLTPQEQAHLASARPVNPEAYEAYLRGQFQWGKLNEEGLKKSIEYFQRAIEIDPGYALAYAGLAASYAVLGQQEILPPREAYSKTRKVAMKALELDGTLAEAHNVLGWVHRNYDWDLPGAEKEFKRALELNPGSAAIHHGYSAYFGAMGQFDESLVEERRAQQLDPLSSFYNGQLALALFEAGWYEEGMDQCQRTLELDPTNSRAHFGIGVYYEKKGKYDQAIAELRRSVELSGSRIDVLAELGHAYVLAGKRAQAENILTQMKELSKERNVSPLGLAVLYASLGNKDQAFSWLEKAYDERSPFLLGIRFDPDFESLRSDPRFTDLLRRMGLPQ